MMLFILTSAGLIYFHYKKILSIKIIFIGVLAGIVFLFFFGVMGNLRQVSNLKQPYSSDLFFKIGQPTDQFKNSFVPKEFLWGYIYISSSLANLQTNLQTDHHDKLANPFPQFVNNEMIPDFISKRINKLLGWKRADDYRIPGPFNVSTVYSQSFSYLGWVGLFLMAGFIISFPWIYIRVLPRNEYALIGLAILSSMYLFLVFDNTIRFTGFSFQLVYPIVYPMIEKRLIKLKSNK
jgi:hypothetical protein